MLHNEYSDSLTLNAAHLQRFAVLGDAKGLLNAAMRTNCLLVPLLFTALTADSLASGVPPARGLRLADLCVRPGVTACRLGVRVTAGECSFSSPSMILPGVLTRHSSRDCVLF